MLKVIEKTMNEKKVSQVKMSADTGLSKTYISNFLAGRIKNPTIETLEKICKSLDIELFELFAPNQPIYGVVLLNDKTYRIETFEQLERLYSDYLEIKNNLPK